MRRMSAAGLGLLVALTAVSCSSASHAPAPTSTRAHEPIAGKETDFSQIRSLLRARAAAVVSHDEKAFLATVDPDNAKLRKQQTVLYENLAALPVESMSYHAEDFSLTKTFGVPAGVPALTPPVTEYVELRGADSRPVSNPVEETFVRRKDHWLLGAEKVFEFEGSTNVQSRPWGDGPIDVATSGNIVVATDKGSGVTAYMLLHQVASDAAYDARVLGRPLGTGLMVDATSSGVPHRMNPISKENAAAVTYPVYEQLNNETESTPEAGVVVKLDPKDLRESLEQYDLFRHELTHVTLQRDERQPTWLIEGIAEYVGLSDLPTNQLGLDPASYAKVKAMARRPKLPDSGDFYFDPGVNYELGRAAVQSLVDRFGMAKVLDLMRVWNADTRKTGRMPADDAELKKVLDISAHELAQQAIAITLSEG